METRHLCPIFVSLPHDGGGDRLCLTGFISIFIVYGFYVVYSVLSSFLFVL